MFVLAVYAGGIAGAELAGAGYWRQAFWPYHAAKRLGAWAASEPEAKNE